MTNEIKDVYDRCQDIDDKYDQKIGDLDKKYDGKNDKILERFDAVSGELKAFVGPIAEMGAVVEANKLAVEKNMIAIKLNADKLDGFKSKIFWAMVSAIGTMILLGLNLAFGV